MIQLIENRLELSLSQYCAMEDRNPEIFSMKALESFPDIPVSFSQFNSLIDAKFLSYITSKGKLETHVTLCATLLAKENPTAQKKFYDTVLQFDNQDWIFAFVSGLLKKPLHGGQFFSMQFLDIFLALCSYFYL